MQKVGGRGAKLGEWKGVNRIKNSGEVRTE